MRRFFSRNIRLYILFVLSLSWYIFARFGGVSMNRGAGDPGGGLMNCTEGGREGGRVFCHHLDLRGGTHGGFWYVLHVLTCGLLLIMALR